MTLIKLSKNNKFDPSTIKLVDLGVWSLLVGSHNNNSKVRYALRAGNEYYFLDSNGGIIFHSLSYQTFILRMLHVFLLWNSSNP